MDIEARPLIRLRPGADRRLKAGYPWAFSNEIAMRPELRALPAGGLVRLEGDDGVRFGTCFYNPHSLIAARQLDHDPAAEIDAAWIRLRLAEAASLRARFFTTPFHRLVHAEADRLPGLVIDRFGPLAVVQANTAGMDRLLPEITAALEALLPLSGVLARNDSGMRGLEGLAAEVRLLAGALAQEIVVEEGGLVFPVDPQSGQKTGWFYDQKENRDQIAALAHGARVLDLFCHTGGFGLRAAAAGAEHALLVDSSAAALALARAAAERNGLAVEIKREDAFVAMGELAASGAQFDIVIADPPPFIPSRKDQAAGLRGYARMARMAAALVAPGGFLFAASCSHHAPPDAFAAAVAHGLARAGREGRTLCARGNGPDHPVHPHLPESAYLKTLLLQLF
ncbi:MAG TPA: class I SAM-dependent rRNA methyltransferase [Acetobacteraceae bacterium]|jgi:23S rRNA (cytosine1962-C5)-methyltransferase|nr:class I SAM-dependent rRNA methyltransferase [Acetobacteraceae bacterium]